MVSRTGGAVDTLSEPVPPTQHLEVIGALRGFALFGVGFGMQLVPSLSPGRQG